MKTSLLGDIIAGVVGIAAAIVLITISTHKAFTPEKTITQDHNQTKPLPRLINDSEECECLQGWNFVEKDSGESAFCKHNFYLFEVTNRDKGHGSGK